MLFKGLLNSVTANQIIHALLILDGGNPHYIDSLLDQIW